MDQSNRINPQSGNNDISEIQTIQSTRSCVCIRSKFTWIIFTIVVIASITIPTTIILTKKKNVAETNSTTIMMTTTGRESIALMLTTTTTGPSTTTTTGPSTTTTTTTTTTEAGLISLKSTAGVVYGVHDTRISHDSRAAQSGPGIVEYPKEEPPAYACDGDTSTKYLNFAPCLYSENSIQCGLHTGFYLELKGNASLVTRLQICTADDFPARDPLTVSLEGSNHSGSNLTLGSSWALIYNGSSGLEDDPGRRTCGIIQLINNSIQYTSYRFLVSSKRSSESSVQYSELKLFEY
ncbi:unnamed protein product [Adineta steineri]|uniref:Uncharacterized protein n=1 Tax=Adineta steineri TaxID=433720 RepID=A0A819C6Q8_9BILA|nr:unnamed protein product [Adineta steineri]CAF3813804.1 unnamed protein product [Adineta steineri]